MKPAPAPGAQHVPATLHLIDAYDDGRDARHLTFACVDAPHTFGNAMPGQFFMLNVPGAGEIALTFSALPDARGHFGALVRRVGSVTSALFALAPGAVLGARGPFGNGWPMLQLASGRVLVVGGGCGLAPLVAAVRQLHDHGVAHAVLYSARDHHAQILHSERAQWHRDGIALLEVFDEPHRIGPVPHLDAALAALGGMPDTVITCGPEAMMFALARALTQRGLAGERIFVSMERRMHCGTGHCGHCYIGGHYCCTDGPVLPWPAVKALRNV
jgi:anaerobic sulfite reductase subunit B